MRTLQKVGLEDRLQYQEHCHLHDSILDRWNAQGPLFPIGFWNINPTHCLWPVAFGSEFRLDLLKELLDSCPGAN
jgi:hypothetical protein